MKGKTILLLALSFCFIASSCSSQQSQTQYKPLKVGQIAWQRDGNYLYTAIEIINENSNVGLYNSPISVIIYNEDKKIIGTNMFIGDYGKMHLLLPNEKIIYAFYISDAKENPADIKVTFPELAWIDFSKFQVPKAKITEINLVEDEDGDKTLFFMLANESENKFDFHIVFAFYTSDGKLFGADFGSLDDVPAKSSKPYERTTPLKPPKDAKLVVKAYPTRIPDLEK